MVVDPSNSHRLFAAAAELRTRTCHLLRSDDSGRTWSLLDASPSPRTYPFCTTSSGMLTQTPLAFGRDGHLYFAMAGWDTQDGGPGSKVSVIVSRSDDFGETWQSTAVRDARSRDPVENHGAVAALVVDAQSGPDDIVYVGWRANYPQAPLLPGGLRALRPPLVATSTDGGRTFSDPVDVSSFYGRRYRAPDGTELPIGMGFTAPSLTVDGHGTLYSLYPAAAPSAFPPNTAPPLLPMLLGRSTDRGKTWTIAEVGEPLRHNEAVQIIRWSPGGGPEGTLHYIHEDKPDQRDSTADRDIYYRHSTDGGKTFAKAVKLNDDDPAKYRVQVTPNFSIAPNGRIDVVWWDFRNDPGTFVNDVYLTSSSDNGATWSPNVRITDRSIDRKLGVWSNGYDIRQPPGIASTSALTVVAWDDTRLATPVTEGQDIFARTAQFKALPAEDSQLPKYALAAFAGLALAGLIFLAAGRQGSAQS